MLKNVYQILKKYIAIFNLRQEKYRIIILLVIGIVAFGLLFQKAMNIKNFTIMGTRLSSCNAMLSALFHGYPQFARYYSDGSVTKYPNYGDDKGIFIIVPWIAFHFDMSIIEAAKFFTAIMLAFIGLILPIILYLIFGSLLLSFLSVILLLLHTSFRVLFNGFDLYWIQGWINVIGVWLLVLLYKQFKIYQQTKVAHHFNYNIIITFIIYSPI